MVLATDELNRASETSMSQNVADPGLDEVGDSCYNKHGSDFLEFLCGSLNYVEVRVFFKFARSRRYCSTTLIGYGLPYFLFAIATIV